MDYRCEASVVSEVPLTPAMVWRVWSLYLIVYFSASLSDLKIVIVNDDSISTDLQPKAINGNLVYLCRSTDDDTDDILECYGLGKVS